MKAFKIARLSLALASLVILGCENRDANPETSISMGEIREEGEYHFTVIMVDNCEYLMLMMDRNHPHEGFGFMAHKGNCRNPIHIYNPDVPYVPTVYDSSVVVGRPLKIDK
ncbi:MAG: hypothetical protein RIB71_00765 [Imperialibacter sp.]|uniref:hypothetical protein n=1 Tax=Imperialibacter sp. TaxID=2038411 RepID=UPI0032EF402D